MQISERGCRLIKNFEGLRLRAYQDEKGVWTIGYGHTGSDVYPGRVISHDEAEAIFSKRLRGFEHAINNSVKVSLTQEQYDALCSFVYNVGIAAFRKSTLLRKLNGGDYAGAASEMLRWKYVRKASGPVVSRGLEKRRVMERNLFERGAIE